MEHSLKDQLYELKSLVNEYPNFVYSKNDDTTLDGIPVFVYHTMQLDLFESHLQYLSENGYRTLSIHDFYRLVIDNKPINSKKVVLLTIDDARSSVWRYAYPLLKKYEMHATVFIIPGITVETDTVRPNLDNYWNSEYTLDQIDKVDVNDDTLCNWTEIKEMYHSGNVNIESHTLYHREIFKNLNIVNFITKNTSFIPYNFIGSPYYEYIEISKTHSLADFVGLPIFESAPIMCAGPKLDISLDFIKTCKELYNSSSSEIKWQNEIKKLVNDQSSSSNYFEIKPNSKIDTTNDLKIAREIIHQKLDDRAGNHLCLPWTQGNSYTVDICKELNIKSCFWGLLKNKKINKIPDNPYYITRLKNDFVFRLPGDSRKSLLSIYSDKIKRRISGDKVF